MCLRYKLVKDWISHSELEIGLGEEAFAGNDDTQPADLMPIVRVDAQGNGIVSMSRWGLQRRWPNSQTGKIVTRQFNTGAEELEAEGLSGNAYTWQRCVVPMSSWYKWLFIEGKRTRVEISMRRHTLFYAAGLSEMLVGEPNTSEPIDTFTIVTVQPEGQLGTVHDRAPLILRPEALEVWNDAGWPLVKALVRENPRDVAFYVRPAPLNVGCRY